jgi:signal transduction histidine kinase
VFWTRARRGQFSTAPYSTSPTANGLGNALNYLDPKRPSRIEVGSLGLDQANAAAGLCIYYVRDNGLGISESGRAKVFQPFQRLHPQAAAGEGLGLAIVQRVVERHGGRIWFESAVGQGTTFFVALPAFPDGVAAAHVSATSPDPGKGPSPS